MSTATMMTVEDFAQVAAGADSEDFELVEGALIPLASGTPLHAKNRQNVELLAASYFSKHPIGVVLSEVDCRLGPFTGRRPDASIFLLNRFQGMDPKKTPLPFSPDIAVEVLSPSESAVDVHRKALDYLAAGSQEVWILDAENDEIFVQTASGIRLLRSGDTLETPLLPGFSAAVSALLAGF